MRASTAALTGALFLALSASASAQERRVVGGTSHSIASVPWQVAVASKGPGSGYERQFCGGSLVAPTIVVSAAHCFYDMGPDPEPDNVGACTDDGSEGFNAPAEDFEVFTGRTVLSSSQGQVIDLADFYYFAAGPGGQPVAVAASAPGENGLYECATNRWDVALLELASPSVSPPILIAGGDERALWGPDRPALISGWGSRVQGGSFPDDYPDDLQAAWLEIIADEACASAYAAGGVSIDGITMVCAGAPGGAAGTCQGDSGGPIAVQGEIGRAIGFRVVGATSFAIGCASPEFPSVYARIAADPIRAAVATAARRIAGVEVVGSGARPVAAPETTIVKHPRKRVKTRRRRARAGFRFSADEPATFECKLDRKRARPCASPYRRHVKRGWHRFRVTAIDSVDHRDRTPATFRWRVKRRNNRRPAPL